MEWSKLKRSAWAILAAAMFFAGRWSLNPAKDSAGSAELPPFGNFSRSKPKAGGNPAFREIAERDYRETTWLKKFRGEDENISEIAMKNGVDSILMETDPVMASLHLQSPLGRKPMPRQRSIG